MSPVPEIAPETSGFPTANAWQLLVIPPELVPNAEDPPRVRLSSNGRIEFAGSATVKAGENIGAGATMATLEGALARSQLTSKQVPFLSNKALNVMLFSLVEAGKQTIKPAIEIKSAQVVSFEGVSCSLN